MQRSWVQSQGSTLKIGEKCWHCLRKAIHNGKLLLEYIVGCSQRSVCNIFKEKKSKKQVELRLYLSPFSLPSTVCINDPSTMVPPPPLPHMPHLQATCFVREWFNDEQITIMNWPAQSPDLNPIEKIWDQMKTKVPDSRSKSNK